MNIQIDAGHVSMLRAKGVPLLCGTHGSVEVPHAGPTQSVGSSLEAGMRLERSASNLVENPSVETGTTGWSFFGGEDSLDLSTESARHGVQSLKFTRGVAAGASFVSLDGVSLASATSYAVTVFVRVFGGLGASDIRAEAVDFSGVSQTYRRVWTPADGEGVWVRLETRIVTTSATSGSIRLRTSGSAPPAGGGFYVDAAQLEVGERATSYCDGSLGEGYAWTGTPHASTSTRAAGALSLPGAQIPVVRGGLLAWLRPSWGADDAAARTLLHRRVDADEAWRVGFDPAQDAWVMDLTAAGATATVALATSHAEDEDVFLAAGWDARHLWLSDGAMTAVATRAGRPPSIPRTTPIEVGRRQDDGSEHIDAVVGPLVFLDGPPSRADIVAASRFRRLPDWPRAPRTLRAGQGAG
jgi:hypothetical protein